jgi:hypothetical protein
MTRDPQKKFVGPLSILARAVRRSTERQSLTEDRKIMRKIVIGAFVSLDTPEELERRARAK